MWHCLEMANPLVAQAYVEVQIARRLEARAEAEALYIHNPTHRELTFRRRVQAEDRLKRLEEWMGRDA